MVIGGFSDGKTLACEASRPGSAPLPGLLRDSRRVTLVTCAQSSQCDCGCCEDEGVHDSIPHYQEPSSLQVGTDQGLLEQVFEFFGPGADQSCNL